MDCLITKLKASVSDNTLPKFNVLTINVEKRTDLIENPVADNVSFIINVVSPTTIKANGGWFSVNSFSAVDADKLTEYVIPADTDTTIWCKWDDFTLEVLDASTIKKFQTCNYTNTNNPNYTVPSCIAPMLFSQMPYLERLVCIYSNVTGTLSALQSSVNYSGLLCLTPNVARTYYELKSNLTGSIKDISTLTGIINVLLMGTSLNNQNSAIEDFGASELGKLTNLQSFYIRNSGAGGSIEKFVELAVDSGKTSNSEGVETERIFINFTFFGEKMNDRRYNKLFWDGKDKIWIYGSSSGYSNYDKVYAHGCTAEEKAAWEAQDMEVVTFGDDN